MGGSTPGTGPGAGAGAAWAGAGYEARPGGEGAEAGPDAGARTGYGSAPGAGAGPAGAAGAGAGGRTGYGSAPGVGAAGAGAGTGYGSAPGVGAGHGDGNQPDATPGVRAGHGTSDASGGGTRSGADPDGSAYGTGTAPGSGAGSVPGTGGASAGGTGTHPGPTPGTSPARGHSTGPGAEPGSAYGTGAPSAATPGAGAGPGSSPGAGAGPGTAPRPGSSPGGTAPAPGPRSSPGGPTPAPGRAGSPGKGPLTPGGAGRVQPPAGLVKLARSAAELPRARRPGGDRSAAARTRAVLEQSFGQLPAAEGAFTGRAEPLAYITRAVHQARAATTVQPTVVVLHGEQGSGRTTLAVRAARQLRDQFRGACVVNLRGADEARTGVATRDALLHLLNRLGAPRDQLLFRDRQDRQDQGQHLRRLMEQYQQHLTGVPVVIVLDDATDPQQVAALVPERSESLVLVTADEPLDLELPGARVHHYPVEALSPQGVHGLLRQLAEEAGLEPPGTAQAARLGELCAGLPLALRIAGGALADHHGPDRLAADIEVFGPRPAVDRILALRYHDQPEPNRRLLRRLALTGRASFGAAAAAALLATDDQEAARRLAELAKAGLIDQVRGSRYRPHDLVRAFAAERLLDEEDPVERAAAHERLIRSYADLANTVVRLVEGKTSTRAGRFGHHGFTSLENALRWLDEESSFITAALRRTEGVDRAAVQALLGALCDYCLLRGDLYRLGEISELAQGQQSRAAHSGPDEDRSVLVRSVQWRTGIAARQLGELDRAKSTLSTVVDLYFEAQHPAGAARALDSLGITLHHQGNLREAEAKLREALAIQTAPELEEDRAWTMHALAAVLRDMGQLAGALELLYESLALHRANESVQGEAWAHLQLGQVFLLLGRLEEGEAQLRAAGQAYALARDPRGTAWTTTQLARARLLRGEAREASADLEAALQRHRTNEDARGEAWSLYYLGLSLEECGDLDAALRTLERSRTMFSRMRDVYGLACARHNSARVTRDQRAARTGNLRNSGFARQLLQDARQDFRRIGVPHGEAWSCVELAVIDAGNERPAEAVALLDEAYALFAELGDRRGQDWALFLRATVLPLLSEEGARQAADDLHALAARAPYPAADPDLDGYVAAYAVLLARGSTAPWPAWRLAMTPTRTTRMTMALPFA
ncbi:tetratricopeptide repeat protein [Streptomyces sp. PRB2-1]|uniref:Tetratricopeptide repeat protein n=1 Tax=Actinacidiphila epipremni TaxID=2053013 RepID=A0ABX0ZIH4_9ACTN|nr:tetratricopeptide repeat protein [Actinacidiphila epipremni]